MSEFAKQAHPDAAHRERLSREIPGLSPRQVQVWFQNRYVKNGNDQTSSDDQQTCKDKATDSRRPGTNDEDESCAGRLRQRPGAALSLWRCPWSWHAHAISRQLCANVCRPSDTATDGGHDAKE